MIFSYTIIIKFWLVSFDFWYVMGDNSAWKKGKKDEEEIKKMMDELGDDSKSLYKMYAKKSGMNEALKDPRPSHYEKFLYKKMKKWGIADLSELEGEAKVRFDKELEDYEGDGEDEVEVNMPNMGEGLFPEMIGVKGRNGGLDYADRKTGEKSLTASTFGDSGNLYPEHLTPKWEAPSAERRKRGWSDK